MTPATLDSGGVDQIPLADAVTSWKKNSDPRPEKISGYSHQQLTRLITQYSKTGRLQRRQRIVSVLKPRYTEQDIRLLAAMG